MSLRNEVLPRSPLRPGDLRFGLAIVVDRPHRKEAGQAFTGDHCRNEPLQSFWRPVGNRDHPAPIAVASVQSRHAGGAWRAESRRGAAAR